MSKTAAGKAEAIKFATLDSTVALDASRCLSMPAILIVAAATFHSRGQHEVAEIQDAYKLLIRTLGRSDREHAVRHGAARVGSKLHAHRNAGRPNRDGRLSEHPAAPVVRRLITRLIAIIPAVIVTADLWRKRHGQAAGLQPGGFEPAAFLCGHPADPFHE